MIKAILERLRQKHRTIGFPREEPVLPERFRGAPAIDPNLCDPDCADCVEACPTGAIQLESKGHKLSLDLGKCLFCTDCLEACPEGALSYTHDYRMAASKREDLIINGKLLELSKGLDEKSKRLFGRSLKLRQVSAGGCNGCEVEVNVLNTVVFDLARFGIQFVASPRHADGLLITGPVTKNMEFALKETYEAMPWPKIVIACGACAISGGPFIGHSEQNNGADSQLPVDLYIPGCPPHPVTILDGLLRLLGKIENTK